MSVKPKTPGQANLTGIHYQLVRSLSLATRVLELKLDDPDVLSQYQIVLEPSNGGDAALEGPRGVEIEQMKTRSTGTWGLSEVIHEVLPDLYREVANYRQRKRSVHRARFVTDQPLGLWNSVEEFFCSLAAREEPIVEPVWEALDDSKLLEFKAPAVKAALTGAGLKRTERGLFRHIAALVTCSPEPSPAEERSVWALLRTFQFKQVDSQSVRAEVERMLRGRVAIEKDLVLVLRALLGTFFEEAKVGGTIVVRDLLAQHGLADISLSERPTLVQRGKRNLNRSLARLRYIAEEDVRATRWHEGSETPIRETKPLVLHGESGQGKSWALYARALRLAKQGRLVVLVEAATDREATSRRAAAEFCHDIWGHDAELTLERIYDRLRTSDPASAGDWLDLLVDGVSSPDVAEQLASYDWSSRGIRLAFSFTASEDLAGRLLRTTCRLEKVTDFSVQQLHDYLRQRLGGRAFGVEISDGSFLRRPIMARIFCDLAEEGTALLPPENEFRLLARYWSDFAQRLPTTVAALAGLAAEPPSGRAYPWTMRTLQEAALDESAILLLTRKGLLRRTSDGRSAELWHDRVMSWAIAEGWAALVRDGRLLPEALVARLQEFRDSTVAKHRWGGRWLGDVLLDLFWILLEPGWGLQETVGQALFSLRNRIPTEPLASLGDRAVPVLFELLQSQPDYARYWLDPLKQIRSPEVSARASDLLRGQGLKTRLAASEILIDQPTEAALDNLWVLRCELERQEPRNLNAIFGNVDKALAACAWSAGDWVKESILRSDPSTEPVDALVYLLPQMPNGRSLWLDLKGVIFGKISTKLERAIVVCLESFQDGSSNEWLLDRVKREDSVGPAARRALFLLEPGRGPDPVEGKTTSLGLARGAWLLPHLNANAEQAESFIAETMAASEDPWQTAWSLLSGFESRIAPETLDILLDAAANRLTAELAAPRTDDRDPLWGPFLFLAKVRSLRLIQRFEARRGGRFEELLADWLCRQGPNDSRARRWREENAAFILERIGGEGLTRVANSWLRDGRSWAGLKEAIDLAVVRPDTTSADLLFEIAMRDLVEGSEHPFTQVHAICALAAIGRTDLSTRGAMKWSLHLSWEEVDLLAEDPPTASDLGPALEAIAGCDQPDPNVVFSLSLARRAENVPSLHRILSAAPLGSELARSCLLALYAIDDRSDETALALFNHLASPETEHISTLGLLRLATPEARAALMKRLEGLTKDPLSGSDNAVLIAVKLLGLEGTRLDVAAFLWDRLDRDRILFVVQDELSAFAELGRQDIDDWLYSLALAEGHFFLSSDAKVAAIQAVARKDRSRAFDAALRLSQPGSSERESAPDLLLEIDPERALTHLHDQLAEEKEILVLAAIGESLHAAGKIGTLLGWLQGASPRVREGACLAAEGLPWTDGLAPALRVLLYDSDWDVRNAANRALDRLWHAGEVSRMVDDLLAEVDTTRRWCLLDDALEVGNPGLWHWQPWVVRLWEGLSPAMRQRATERLKRRRKDLHEKLTKRKRDD